MSVRDQYSSALETVEVVFAAGASQSAAIACGGLRLFGVSMPTAAEGWDAATLTFLTSATEDGTYQPLIDLSTGNEITAYVAAGVNGSFPEPVLFSSWQFMKIRSGNKTTPVAQTAARAIKLQVRSI